MYKIFFVKCLGLLCLVVSVSSKEKTSMYRKRSEVSDQSMSGSGYSYDVNDEKPQEYSFELGDNGQALNIIRDLGYGPFPETQRYAEENLPLPYEQYTKEYSKTPDFQPVAFLVNDDNYKIPGAKVQAPSLFPHLSEYKNLGIFPHAYPYAPGYNHASHKNFLKKGGKLYEDSDFSKRGEKTDTGYKTIDSFSKGLGGEYDNKDIKSIYDQSGGKKYLLFDNGGNYAVKHAAGKASRGGSFGQKDSHNKGSKTTGFHKVYHKDDYNKQHKFYDRADKNGNFNKYGDFNANHGNAQAHFAKGGREDKGYEGNKYGLSDASDKGKFEEVAKGFRKAAGDEGFYQDFAGYSNKGGKEDSSVGGYSA